LQSQSLLSLNMNLQFTCNNYDMCSILYTQPVETFILLHPWTWRDKIHIISKPFNSACLQTYAESHIACLLHYQFISMRANLASLISCDITFHFTYSYNATTMSSKLYEIAFTSISHFLHHITKWIKLMIHYLTKLIESHPTRADITNMDHIKRQVLS